MATYTRPFACVQHTSRYFDYSIIVLGTLKVVGFSWEKLLLLCSTYADDG